MVFGIICGPYLNPPFPNYSLTKEGETMTPAQKLKLKNQLAAIKKNKPVAKKQVEAPAPVKATPASKKKVPQLKPKVQNKRAIKIANIFGTKKSATKKKK